MIRGNIQDSAFILGFSNWKDATRCFGKHEATAAHKAALDFVVSIPNTTSDVGMMLSSAHAKQKKFNSTCLLKIAQSIQYLAKQGIAFRGNGDETDGNFMQLLNLRTLVFPELSKFLDQKSNKYTSPQIQNEVIKIMSMHILRDIASVGCHLSTST